MSSCPENFSQNADDRRPRSAVCTENLNADVMLVKSATDGERLNAPSPLDRAEDRRIFVKGSMSSDVVVIVRVGSLDSAQMRLA